MMKFLLWLLLFVVCWPLAMLPARLLGGDPAIRRCGREVGVRP